MAWRRQGSSFGIQTDSYAVEYQSGVLSMRLPGRAHREASGSAGAEFRLGRPVVRRPGQNSGARSDIVRAVDATLHIDGAQFTERVDGKSEAIELSWRFERRPSGRGALTVELPVLLGRFVSRSTDGLRFRVGASTVRLGHGSWVNADGTVHPVPARFEGGRVLFEVPPETLETASYPAVLDPTLGPEFGMDAPVLSAAQNAQTFPGLAWNGTIHLAAWSDQRLSGAFDIFAARIDGSGAILDPAGLLVAAASGSQLDPVVDWDGTNFLVVWQDDRGANPDIYGARVSPSGGVLEPNGFAISTATSVQNSPAVVWDGVNHLVVWQDLRGGPNSDIYAARVTSGAIVLDPTGIPISTAFGNEMNPSIAFNGTHSLVAWTDQRSGFNIYGSRVTTGGQVLAPSGIPLSTAAGSQSAPSVSTNGVDFFCVWSDGRNSSLASDIYATRVSAAGNVLDPSGIAVVSAPNDQWGSAVAWDGANYLVTWISAVGTVAGALTGARISAGGQVLDDAGIAFSSTTLQNWPALSPTPGGTLVVWGDSLPGGDTNVRSARVSNGGVVLEPGGRLVSSSANTQLTPAAAWGAATFLVVWQDSRGADLDLFGSRVSELGVVLDAQPLSIAPNVQQNPAVAWGGNDFLVAWEDRRSGTADIYATRVSAAGVVREPAGIQVSNGTGNQVEPDIAFDGTNFFVVWADSRSGTGDIYGARVSTAGVVIDPAGLPLVVSALAKSAPKVAWDGARMIVVWVERTIAFDTNVMGAWVDGSGAVVGRFSLGATPLREDQVRIAGSGAGALAAWSVSFGAGLSAARFGTGGVLLDDAGWMLATDAGYQVSPALDWYGPNYLLTWGELQSTLDISGSRVTPLGNLLDQPALVVASTRESEVPSAVACGKPGPCLVTWSRYDGAPAMQAVRVRARLFNDGDAGADAGSSADGGTRFDGGTSVDSGVPDAGAGVDGGLDAGTPDAGTPDAGAPDAGAPDAGASDAGALDAGESDAGPGDADGGGERPTNAPAYRVGCGCAAVDYRAAWVVLALALARLRRRVRRGLPKTERASQ